MSTSSQNVVGTELSLLVLYTNQLPNILRFYEAIGLRFKEERHGRGPVHYAARSGTVVLELYPVGGRQSGEPSSALRLGFRVGSLDAALGTLISHGVEPASTARVTEWGRTAIVFDPDGRTVELSEAANGG